MYPELLQKILLPLKNQLNNPRILIIPIENVYDQLGKLEERGGWVDSQKHFELCLCTIDWEVRSLKTTYLIIKKI